MNIFSNLTTLQIAMLTLYATSVFVSFFQSIVHRKRITLGNAETTIIPLATILILVSKLSFRHSHNIPLNIVGPVLFMFGEILVLWAFPKLGYANSDDFWFGRNEQKMRTLVTEGPYHYVRHPIFDGLVLIYFGLILVFFHPIPLAMFFLAIVFGIYTEFQEEKFMFSRFPEYQEYARRTGRFFPKIL